MTATLWTGPDETIELGGTLQLYQSFAEMAKLKGERYLKDYPALFAVCSAVEDGSEVPTDWLDDVRVEAEVFLEAYKDKLSPDTITLLNILKETPA